MTNIHQKFEQLVRLSFTNKLFKKIATSLLSDVKQYLKSDLGNLHATFSKSEYKFSNNINYFISNQTGGLKKLFPFLVSDAEKINMQLLKEIEILFDKKKEAIKSIYDKDILIVEEFLSYAKQMLRTGEVFYYVPAFKEYLWTRETFPSNMFNYLSYQVRINPDILTTNYIEDMKGYFSFYGLAMDDEEKTRKANHYFLKTKDPFSFNIPEKYNDVRSKIQMSVVVMTQNEYILGKIASDVIERYMK